MCCWVHGHKKVDARLISTYSNAISWYLFLSIWVYFITFEICVTYLCVLTMIHNIISIHTLKNEFYNSYKLLFNKDNQDFVMKKNINHNCYIICRNCLVLEFQFCTWNIFLRVELNYMENCTCFFALLSKLL